MAKVQETTVVTNEYDERDRIVKVTTETTVTTTTGDSEE